MNSQADEQKLQIIVHGARGRMGKSVCEVVQSGDRMEVIAGVSQGGSPWVKHINEIKPPVPASAVVVDFSSPEAFAHLLNWCQQTKTPLVSGTTGFDFDHQALLRQAAQVIPVLWSSNMSLGIHWLNRILSHLKELDGFDIQVEEFHHRRKKDRPSGTALLLQETLRTLTSSLPEPVSIRGGGIFGVHRVHVMSEDETICLEHQALNRTVFAKGAVVAAQWLIQQKAGLYSMNDVLEGQR